MGDTEKKDEGLELLHQLRHITELIEQLQEQIDKTYSMLTSTTIKPKVVDVQTSAPTDQMADRMADILEWQESVLSYQAELCTKKRIALEIIKKMEPKYQRLLNNRYMKGMSIERCGREIGVSYSTSWELIHTAEKIFVEIYASDRNI